MRIQGDSHVQSLASAGLGLGGSPASGGLEAKQASELEAARARFERGDEGEQIQAAKKMESLFATLLVKEMRRALPEGFFGKNSGADVFEGWLDEHLGEALASAGALDLAGMIKTGIQRAESEREQ